MKSGNSPWSCCSCCCSSSSSQGPFLTKIKHLQRLTQNIRNLKIVLYSGSIHWGGQRITYVHTFDSKITSLKTQRITHVKYLLTFTFPQRFKSANVELSFWLREEEEG